MKRIAALGAAAFGHAVLAVAGPFDPAIPGREELAPIPHNDSRIRGWATGYVSSLTKRGPIDITEPDGAVATFGSPQSMYDAANAPVGGGSDPATVMSLGDGGYATLTFDLVIANGPGPDFAVFENAFNNTFLELAFVEVSSNGTDFFRFPNVSLTPLTQQIDQADPLNSTIDPTNIDGLAGKYPARFGTPFDLARLEGVSPVLDVNNVRYVRVRDVIGYIQGSVASGTASEDTASTYRYFGLTFAQNHLINDPWPTDFTTGGFDLDAIAVLNTIPETTASLTFLTGLAPLAALRRRKS